MEEQVILVDERDRPIGIAEKMQAHRDGLLHRAFSIFVTNTKGELLLQKRSRSKYHSGGLWTNTCCSHPRPGESTEAAARRRLQEEMGFSCDLHEIFNFTYQANLDNGLIEHEFDRVFVGEFNGKPILNPEEAEDWCWIEINDLRDDIQAHPDRYTFWLKVCFKKFVSYMDTVVRQNV
ncbi:isopentenyl-diphosphate Delta-isomerase [Pseudanabaena sp. PCC 6802]|uniref:isopentenyl-diphosphate Delta-isomerase n=1 Tax=Pseudanabaena sp. PCC 6802 TaxID=118173 RepID=UPI000564FDF5|nr:isopentenyl-diphosphate Delta-isomerase [Pseudanabaena sp. PCC 6802]